MGNSADKVEAKPAPEKTEKKPLKPCCACLETKKVRDECIVNKGEAECGHLIEAHKACMRYLGFNI
ncbi:cytochrome c oxidase copper chaperone [Phymastichus coffea]|uniref:cytochrome c oxidase copper chaperone n=1 Tax=Phymastichus coffea TaxID=108790 RepID=UPI00273C0D41|nr:cytochrome c oxidase copper chaperone [Phymastichus coffea]